MTARELPWSMATAWMSFAPRESSRTSKASLQTETLKGTFGMGHTRWATHGKPNENNAHPHRDCTGNVVVIHNGIIENFLPLKQRLKAAGHEFKSETDTEVVAHLIEEHRKSGASFVDAVKKSLKELDGHYALVMIAADDPGTIIAAKQGPPLVVGLGEGENIVASDVAPLLAYTRNIIYLEDGEYAIASDKKVDVFAKDDAKVEREPKKITWDAVMAEKEGYRHYMLKEIHEQPRAVRDTFNGRMFEESGEIFFNDLQFTPDEWSKIKKIHIVACGTSWHSGLVGKFMLENAARIPVEVDYGSEYRYRDPILDESTLVIGVTQSGETADTIAGMQEAKAKGAKLISICNVIGAAATRMSDGVIYTNAGPEIGVASTKAFTTQLTAFYLLSLYIRQLRGDDKDDIRYAMHELSTIPHKIEHAAQEAGEAHRAARPQISPRPGLPLPRPRRALPDRARRRAEAEGDLVHPRRGVSGRGDEARADRTDRREHARGCDRDAHAGVRQGRLEPAGSEGARRQDDRDLRRRRRGDEEVRRRLHRGAVGDRAATADSHGRADAASRVLHRAEARVRRRSAEEPGEERDGGVAQLMVSRGSSSPHVARNCSAQRRQRLS